MAKKLYKIEVVKEGAIGTLLVAGSKIPVKKMEETMNSRAEEGWSMEFMVIEQRRLFLFWTREAAVITFSKEV